MSKLFSLKKSKRAAIAKTFQNNFFRFNFSEIPIHPKIVSLVEHSSHASKWS